MQRGKKPDTEIEKGMQRFEPNAERKKSDTECITASGSNGHQLLAA
jgi:hypothetical protein